MERFDLQKRFEYPYVRGHEIAYIDENHDDQTGIIKTHSFDCVELEDGEIINKGRIYALLSEENNNECE